ncbi:MAG: nucleoside triphosphate pyrophosphohydrolase [Dethiobacteria bacterium]|jgi:tetrapyrrole methylase family protein/MazG family protein
MDTLFIITLGNGSVDSLQEVQWDELAGVKTCVAHVLPSYLVERLQKKGLPVINIEESLQNLDGSSWQDLRNGISSFILDILQKEGMLAYIIPGKPWFVAGIINSLSRKQKQNSFCMKEVNCNYGHDTWGVIMDFLRKRAGASLPPNGVSFIDAYSLDRLREPPRGELIISSFCSEKLTPKVRVELLKIYPPEQKVNILQFNRKGEPFLLNCRPLAEIEKNSGLHAWTFLHLPPSEYCGLGDLASLLGVLRAPDGCPWDRKQNHKTLKPYLIEETYEVVDAIDGGDPLGLCEELGDLLLQIVFHSSIAAEKGDFNLWQVIEGITKKMKRRHPHVFGDEKIATAGEVSTLWQRIKGQERKKGNNKNGRLSVPKGLPALMKAQKMQKRAADVGFDWPDIKGALEKFSEEIKEFYNAYESQDQEKIEEELGDLFFALVNVARFLGVESEFALNQCLDKFKNRFSYIEKQVERNGNDFSNFSLEELDRWWDEAKLKEKTGDL